MLTEKQKELLLFIHERMQERGVPPSFDEMKDALDLKSKSGIHRLITALVERGFIRRLPHRARAIEVIKLPENETAGPRTAASSPASSKGPGRPRRGAPPRRPLTSSMRARSRFRSWAASPPARPSAPFRTTRTTSPCSPDLLTNGEHFALEVKGDFMIEAGIHDGDTVIIRRCNSAENGDIVVALVEGEEATLKRLRKKGSTDRARSGQSRVQDTHLRARSGRHPGPSRRTDAPLLRFGTRIWRSTEAYASSRFAPRCPKGRATLRAPLGAGPLPQPEFRLRTWARARSLPRRPRSRGAAGLASASPPSAQNAAELRVRRRPSSTPYRPSICRRRRWHRCVRCLGQPAWWASTTAVRPARLQRSRSARRQAALAPLRPRRARACPRARHRTRR